jgi:hypothetical protein
MDDPDLKDNVVVPSPALVDWTNWHSASAPDGTRNGLGPLGGPDQSISERADAARGRDMVNEFAEEVARARFGARRPS